MGVLIKETRGTKETNWVGQLKISLITTAQQYLFPAMRLLPLNSRTQLIPFARYGKEKNRDEQILFETKGERERERESSICDVIVLIDDARS